MTLSAANKSNLLKFARRLLTESSTDVSLRSDWRWSEKWKSLFPVSDQSPAAAFVTLRKSGQLRGCVGTACAELPLLSIVAKMVLQSAYSDPRFPPLRKEELPQLAIEISVLSDLRKVNGAGEIVPGLHGVCIKKNLNTGLFLPQVWKELPLIENFLNELCVSKAGLPALSWKDPQTELYVFTVDHFGEQEIA